jgi:hypothetical protein
MSGLQLKRAVVPVGQGRPGHALEDKGVPAESSGDLGLDLPPV